MSFRAYARLGAMSYLLKDAPADTLIETIRRVYAGEPFIQPEIALCALRELIRPGSSNTTLVEPLSERETSMLACPGCL